MSKETTTLDAAVSATQRLTKKAEQDDDVALVRILLVTHAQLLELKAERAGAMLQVVRHD